MMSEVWGRRVHASRPSKVPQSRLESLQGPFCGYDEPEEPGAGWERSTNGFYTHRAQADQASSSRMGANLLLSPPSYRSLAEMARLGQCYPQHLLRLVFGPPVPSSSFWPSRASSPGQAPPPSSQAPSEQSPSRNRGPTPSGRPRCTSRPVRRLRRPCR